MAKKSVKIKNSWQKILSDEFNKKYFTDILEKIHKDSGTKNIFPELKNIFRAFELTPFEKVSVIILGQDPYHNEGQAHGLSFSVPENTKTPPSLQNIFKEIKLDLKIEPKKSPDLSRWASQGVLLLNSVLTVQKNLPSSHKNLGWEKFTDEVIKKLSDKRQNLVFILWGNYAKQKEKIIDQTKHLIIKSSHPSPFSAKSGFFGSRPFSKTNKYLKAHNLKEIDWR